MKLLNFVSGLYVCISHLGHGNFHQEGSRKPLEVPYFGVDD